eukprot:jgi/Botrbrau1/14330/Bobra.0222s0002.1
MSKEGSYLEANTRLNCELSPNRSDCLEQSTALRRSRAVECGSKIDLLRLLLEGMLQETSQLEANCVALPCDLAERAQR